MMNSIIIIGIIATLFVVWIVYPNGRGKMVKDYAEKYNWEFRANDKDNKVFEMLCSSLFYVYKNTKRPFYKPFSIHYILEKEGEVVCKARISGGGASAFIPDYLIYHTTADTPKLFVICRSSLTSLGMDCFDLDYYRDEFDEIDMDLSTETHVVIVNSRDKGALAEKVSKIGAYLPEKYNLMIRNGKLAIYTTDKKENFQEFIKNCQQINQVISHV